MPRSFLPSADAQLLAWSANFIGLVKLQPGNYGLTAAQATAYQTVNDAYATAYRTAFDPHTRTAPAIAAKDRAKANLAASARELVRLVQATSTVTDEQRKALKITVAKSRSPVPAPSARPAIELASVVGRLVSVNVYDSSSRTKRGKPLGSVGAKLYTFVGDAYPSDPALWAYQGDYTKTKCEIVFDDFVENGAQVWVCAAWYNRKGETGPISVPLTTNVQGGGAMTAAKLKVAA